MFGPSVFKGQAYYIVDWQILGVDNLKQDPWYMIETLETEYLKKRGTDSLFLVPT